jgi:hypothetical protein
MSTGTKSEAQQWNELCSMHAHHPKTSAEIQNQEVLHDLADSMFDCALHDGKEGSLMKTPHCQHLRAAYDALWLRVYRAPHPAPTP